MAVTPEQVRLVQESFDHLRRDIDTYSTQFYEALFAHAPELREMFRDDLAGQGMKFMSTLDAVVQKLGQEDEIEAEFISLGPTHRALGVTAAQFRPMEEALIDTLRDALGDRFDARLEAAWRAAYGTVAANMIRRGNIPD